MVLYAPKMRTRYIITRKKHGLVRRVTMRCFASGSTQTPHLPAPLALAILPPLRRIASKASLGTDKHVCSYVDTPVLVSASPAYLPSKLHRRRRPRDSWRKNDWHVVVDRQRWRRWFRELPKGVLSLSIYTTNDIVCFARCGMQSDGTR